MRNIKIIITLILVLVAILPIVVWIWSLRFMESEVSSHNSDLIELYVAPNGKDSWSGRLPEPNEDKSDGPFATLERARDEIRSIKAKSSSFKGAIIYLRKGNYFLEEPFVLTSVDSGTENAPIIYRAYKEEEVHIIGGKRIYDFEAYKDGIYQCDLKKVKLSNLSFKQLFFNNKRMILARYPNYDDVDPIRGGWTYIAGVPRNGNNRRSFYYADERPNFWKHPEDCEISIFPNHNWWHTIAKVAKIDKEKKLIILESDLPYEIKPGRRFFYQNIFEELDAPGEWFFDKRSGILYFYPPEPLGKGEVTVPILDSIIKLQGVQYVTLQGLIIEYCGKDGVVIKDCSNCTIAGCVVRHVGGYGIIIDGGKGNSALSNDICDVGRGGIYLSGGDRKTLKLANHCAINNYIYNFSRIYRTYQPGIWVKGVGNRVAHNLIHDSPHIAILLNGNDHIIEYNEVHHVCMETADCGGFYMGRDWTERGNIIRYNKFHDIYGYGLVEERANGTYVYGSPLGAWGVYLDDCASGTTVYGNIFYRIPLCAVMIGGGRDNLIENNIIVECIPAIHIDARWDTYPYDTIMRERLEAVNYRQPPYSTRYPELLTLDGEDPRRPARNKILHNIIVYESDDFRGLWLAKTFANSAVVYDLNPFDEETTTIDYNLVWHFGIPVRIYARFYGKPCSGIFNWKEWQLLNYDSHSLIADPLFIDPESDNYQLDENSPAYNLGFKPIPVDKIGLYLDGVRKHLPPPDTRREKISWREYEIKISPP